MLAVPTVRSVLGMWRLPFGLVAAVAGSYVLAIALSWHGPNQWPYAWLDGVRRPTFPPAIKHVLLDSPLLWLLVLVVVVGVLVASSRVVGTRDPRLNVLRAVPILVAISLVGTTVYTVLHVRARRRAGRAAFLAVGPEPGRPHREPVRRGGRDRGARPVHGRAARRRRPGCPRRRRRPASWTSGGYYAGNRPQGVAADRVWGSLVARDGASAERTRGPGHHLLVHAPGPDGAGTVTVIAAGSLADGVTLTAEYGRRSGDTVEPAGTEALTDAAHDPSWRTLTLSRRPARTWCGWWGSTPRARSTAGWRSPRPSSPGPVTLADFLPRAAPVALGWPLAFGWPCQRQPGIVNGITEPAAFGVLWGAKGALSGFSDGAWQPSRGGAFAQVSRSQSVLELATVQPVDPNVQVDVFGSPLGRDRYTLIEDRRTEGGASTATGPRTGG